MISTTGPRDPFIDSVRVLAVLVVVAGHWLTTTVVWDGTDIDVQNALSVLPAAHPATWVVQVMPLLFFVGGFANSRSFDRHGEDALAYLRSRFERLLAPTLVFIVAWLAVGLLSDFLPIDEPDPLARGADLAALPFWFLGLYVIVVALAPALLRLHRRFGWRVPVAMTVGAVLVDVAVHGRGIEAAGVLNYAFVWLLPHQLGFFYADRGVGWLRRSHVALMAVAGLAGAIALVAIAGYPVSMVGVPGEKRWNTDPPSLAIVALTFWLIGASLLLRPALVAWTERKPRLLAVMNARLLTMYLWHVTAIAVVGMLLYSLDVTLPSAGSLAWWATRPLWLAALAVVLAGLVAATRRFEVHPRPREAVAQGDRCTRRVAAWLAVVSLAMGILGFGVSGFDRVVAAGGEGVLGVTTNPMQNLLHLATGLVALAATYAHRLPPLAGATLGALTFLTIGAAGWTGPIEVLALNASGARIHVAIGGVAVAALVVAATVDRRDTTGRGRAASLATGPK